MQFFGFHVTPVCFALREVDFYTVTGCFLYSPPGLQAHLSCISQGYASAGLYPARFSSALTHSAPRLHDGTPSPLHTARIRTSHDYRVFISYCSPSKKKSRADILEMENLVKIIRASLQGASITTQTVDAQAFIDIVGEMINHNPDSLYLHVK